MSKLPKNAKDITGQRFNKLIAVEYSRSNNGALWNFMCDCGTVTEQKPAHVVAGRIKSCGCGMRATQNKGYGLRVGDNIRGVELIAFLGREGHNNYWKAKCMCGKEFKVGSSNLVSGNTNSCGCIKAQINSTIHIKHGKSNEKIYFLWKNIIRRCYEEKSKAYQNYGGRGIKVSDSWLEFDNFYKDMGDAPPGLTLDRIDNDSGYSKDNCRWATRIQQGNNTRSNVRITYLEKTQTIAEWSRELEIPYARLRARLNVLKWPVDKAFTRERFYASAKEVLIG